MNKKKADPPPKAASQKDCSDTGTSASREDGKNIIKNARLLFKSVPVLGALFSEVLISQCLSSLINFLFVIQVKDMIVDDKQRAGWMGKVGFPIFTSTINTYHLSYRADVITHTVFLL